jgi:hypothetical protein
MPPSSGALLLLFSATCRPSAQILRKDLRVKSLPLPVIVHAAATASKAAAPSLRDASDTLDPFATTSECGIYEGARGG